MGAGPQSYSSAVQRAKAEILAETANGSLGPLNPGGADAHTLNGGNAPAHQEFSEVVAEATLGVDGEGKKPGAPPGQAKKPAAIIKPGGEIVMTNTAKSFEYFVKADRIDAEHGIVFGWAMVCKEGGQDYIDLQKDHIPEDSMLNAVVKFCEDGMVAKDMHQSGPAGQHLFLFPLTTDIAKALGIETKKTGCLIGYKPPPDILAKYKDGTYTGFSIGGERDKDEEVA